MTTYKEARQKQRVVWLQPHVPDDREKILVGDSVSHPVDEQTGSPKSTEMAKNLKFKKHQNVSSTLRIDSPVDWAVVYSYWYR